MAGGDWLGRGQMGTMVRVLPALGSLLPPLALVFLELVALGTVPGEHPAGQRSCLSPYEQAPGPLPVPGFRQKLESTPPLLHSCLKCP